MVFRVRKLFGKFEERAPAPIRYFSLEMIFPFKTQWCLLVVYDNFAHLQRNEFHRTWCKTTIVSNSGQQTLFFAGASTRAAFLWGDPDQDQWPRICLDHGTAKEPVNPLWSWIHRFLWSTMIQTDLGSLIRIRITPKERSLIKRASLKITAHVKYWYAIWGSRFFAPFWCAGLQARFIYCQKYWTRWRPRLRISSIQMI